MIHFLLKYTLNPNLGSYNINMSVYDTIISIQAIDDIFFVITSISAIYVCRIYLTAVNVVELFFFILHGNLQNKKMIMKITIKRTVG